MAALHVADRAWTRFELADAMLGADGPVKALVGQALAPEHRRGHGALYAGLTCGRWKRAPATTGALDLLETPDYRLRAERRVRLQAGYHLYADEPGSGGDGVAGDERPTARKPYLAGGAEFAVLYDVRRLQVSQWISRDHTLDYRYAKIISGSPYWLLKFVKGFGETTPRPKHLNEVELDRLVKEQDPGYWVGEVAQLPPLVGQAELVALFQLPSSALLRKAMSTGRLRPADYTLSGSPIWLLEPVVEDAPALQAGARGVNWAIDEQVLAALRDGSYDGPGARIIPRGKAAHRTAE